MAYIHSNTHACIYNPSQFSESGLNVRFTDTSITVTCLTITNSSVADNNSNVPGNNSNVPDNNSIVHDRNTTFGENSLFSQLENQSIFYEKSAKQSEFEYEN